MTQPDPSRQQSIEGNSNRTAQGDGSLTNQGDGNQGIQGNENLTTKGNNSPIFNRIMQGSGKQQAPAHGDSHKKRQRDRTEQTLLDYVQTQVRKRLEQSLHNHVYIVLDKQEDQSQVEHPWAIDVKIGDQPSSRLPQETTIDEVFDRPDIAGRLLILGAPGSGKTTMLLKLAEKLAERAQNDAQQPIPVLLNLSSWKEDNLSLKQWIVADLKLKYGVRTDIAEKWVKEGTILPLLDGLDELALQRQENCVQTINEFLKPETWMGSLVVCSRTKEYQLYTTKLGLSGSIILQPLTTEQIRNYVLKTEGQPLWNSIKNDSDLMGDDPDCPGLARTPLLLNIIILSCSEIFLAQWQQFNSFEERRSYLFDAYIRRMLGRTYRGKGQAPKDEDTLRWLGWLAVKLIEQNKTEFLIERMQPSWLESRTSKRIFGLIRGLINGLSVGLIGGLIGGLGVGLTDGLSVGLSVGLIYGLSVGLIFGLIAGQLSDSLDFIEMVGTLKISIKQFQKNLIFNLIVVLIHGLFGGLIYGLINGLIFGLIFGLTSPEVETKTFPNQGTFLWLQNVVKLTIIIYLFAILLFSLPLWAMGQKLITSLLQVLIVASRGLLPFTFMGLLLGGIVVIQHFSLRLVLWHSKAIPWNYAKFLNYATNRLFLQQVGGGYRFIHDLLRQHFAETYGKRT